MKLVMTLLEIALTLWWFLTDECFWLLFTTELNSLMSHLDLDSSFFAEEYSFFLTKSETTFTVCFLWFFATDEIKCICSVPWVMSFGVGLEWVSEVTKQFQMTSRRDVETLNFHVLHLNESLANRHGITFEMPLTVDDGTTLPIKWVLALLEYESTKTNLSEFAIGPGSVTEFSWICSVLDVPDVESQVLVIDWGLESSQPREESSLALPQLAWNIKLHWDVGQPGMLSADPLVRFWDFESQLTSGEGIFTRREHQTDTGWFHRGISMVHELYVDGGIIDVGYLLHEWDIATMAKGGTNQEWSSDGFSFVVPAKHRHI